MFWFIIGFICGAAFIAGSLTIYAIYSYGKSAEQAYKEGWDMPHW